MQTNCSFFGIACRAAAFSFVLAGTVALAHAQQPASSATAVKTPLFLASASAPLNLTSSSSASSSSSSSSWGDEALPEERFNPSLPFDPSQPPPRRRYGRPNYSDSHSNPDGSPKFAFLVGVGAALPIGNTHKYYTPSWGVQAGVARNWSQSFGVTFQFDYDHLGLQGATLANQQYLYNFYGCSACTSLDGNSHIWSFTLNPTFTLAGQGSTSAYFVAGGGFYHKVTNFTVPTVGTYCDYYYGCYQYQANQIIDHYFSNAGGVNAGLGLTYKFSRFSNEKFYIEGRYVVIFDPQRYGVTAANSTATLNAYTGNYFYPQNSNRTTYIPIKVGIRF